MAADLEEQKKAILPFMQRAQEIQQADPKVAYYCRLYAVEQAMKMPQRAKEINALLAATLNQLERDKARLELDPAADRIHCLGFALRIFDNADRVDRAGKATERTCKAFYAASVFIEILNAFEGGVDAELFEKQRYCAWRAAEIRKALREGRQPLPPPSATPPPPSDGAAASGSQAGDLADLPLASGTSDWAYGRSTEQSYAADAAAAAPVVGHAVEAAAAARSAAAAATAALDRSSSAGGGAAVGAAARFAPGSRLLVRTEEGLEGGADGEVQQGTVGAVLPRPDGGFSYKVALRDRLVEVPDEAAVPALAEGDAVSMRLTGLAGPGAGGVVPGTVVFISDAGWPPAYLVRTEDGRELAAAAAQLGPLQAPAGVPSAAAAPPPTQPDLLSMGSATGFGPGVGFGSKSFSGPQPPPPPAAALPSSSSFSGPSAAPILGGPSAASPYPTVNGGSSFGAHPPPPPSHPSQPPPPSRHPYPHAAAPQPSPAQHSWSGALPATAAAPAPLPNGAKPPLNVIMDAQKQAKYAVSALSFEDIPTAVKHLSEALRLLTNPPR